MKLMIVLLAMVTWASEVSAQVRPIIIQNAAPVIHSVNPVVIPRTVTPVNPVVHNLSPVKPLYTQPELTIQPQRLSSAQSSALNNAVRNNNYNLYYNNYGRYVAPNQTIENPANHIAHLQGIIQSGIQPTSVQPGAGLGYGTTSASYTGETIRQAQTALRRLGYYHGQVDGQFGPLTQDALKNYQRNTNQPATGLFDRLSLSQLGVEAQ
jgi:Putative peptidoglycan binding domain